MKKLMVAVVVIVVVSPGRSAAQQAIPFMGNRVVRVMTRNVYHGVDAEIFDVPNATSFVDLLVKVATVYNGYLVRDFPRRAAALAAEIDATRPELIGPQEAILVRTQSPADGAATPATAVKLDYITLLLDALAARGLAYEVVAQSVGFDIELPSALGIDVRHTDREVILARSDLLIADLKLSNVQAGAFVNNCQIPTVSTHLDGDCLPVTSSFQQAQAAELLASPAATDLPVVLVGDFNTPTDGTGVTYNNLMAAGFQDAWTLAGGGGDGRTCCQADDLLNAVSTLDRRIDLVLFRGAVTPLAATLVGNTTVDMTPSLMVWPSDHAGVVATLRLPQP